MALQKLKKWRNIPAKLKSIARNNLDLIVTSAETSENLVSLTFDDGPHPAYTPRILELLDKYQAKATFFVVGKLADKYPSILQQMKNSGHAIGNHTWHHSPVPLIPRRERIRQLRKTQHLINHDGQKLFRPPWGFINWSAYLDAKLLGFKIICWDEVVYDWLNPSPAEVFQRLDSNIRPGSIILLHDNICNTIKPEYVPRDNLIEGLERYLKKYQAGYKFVTVPKLLQHGSPQYKYGLKGKDEKARSIPENVLQNF
ncbi:MAG TPA: polysaccharide deacetylase family protein [Balneolaceae bacterium]|nr:polysaccharide deacetylase family protein [Balneolaceae bacterium]